MAWQNPKTNWNPGDGIMAGDLNRIEGNTQALFDMHEVGGSQSYYISEEYFSSFSNSVFVAHKRLTISNRLKVISGDMDITTASYYNQGTFETTLTVYGGMTDIIYGPVNIEEIYGQVILDRNILARNNFGLRLTATVPYRHSNSGSGYTYNAFGIVSAWLRLMEVE